MKRSPSKKDIRHDLEDQVEAFLRKGGEIEAVDRGRSGWESNNSWRKSFQVGNEESKVSRTPVPEVLAAIDSRKKKKTSPAAKRRRPRKEWIYDDFGEPVRWVWKE